MNKLQDTLPGILLCFLTALPAWLLGKAFPIIGGPIFGITFGILVSSVKKPVWAEKGIAYTAKKILQYSIILLGFEMNLFTIIAVGRQSLLVIISTLSASFLTAFVMGRLLKLERNTTILIGVGTSICGGSAIAATAPIISAENEEVAHSISTIFLFNIIAVFIFPLLGRLLLMSDMGFGMWAGTAINDTSSVVAAGSAWSSYAGNETALSFAAIVKLTRTLMIIPVTLVLAMYTSRAAKRAQTAQAAQGAETSGGNGGNFRFTKIFPWFVLGFAGAALVNTFTPIPLELSSSLGSAGKFMIIMALTAIGMNTKVIKLFKNGFRPIFLGLCCWFAVASVSLLVQKGMQLW